MRKLDFFFGCLPSSAKPAHLAGRVHPLPGHVDVGGDAVEGEPGVLDVRLEAERLGEGPVEVGAAEQAGHGVG